jgi:hypothetical protein
MPEKWSRAGRVGVRRPVTWPSGSVTDHPPRRWRCSHSHRRACQVRAPSWILDPDGFGRSGETHRPPPVQAAGETGSREVVRVDVEVGLGQPVGQRARLRQEVGEIAALGHHRQGGRFGLRRVAEAPLEEAEDAGTRVPRRSASATPGCCSAVTPWLGANCGLFMANLSCVCEVGFTKPSHRGCVRYHSFRAPHWPAYPSAVVAVERRVGGVLRKRHEDGAACDNLAWPLAVEGVTRVGHRVNERAFAGG